MGSAVTAVDKDFDQHLVLYELKLVQTKIAYVDILNL